jgi:hypothetical protein
LAEVEENYFHLTSSRKSTFETEVSTLALVNHVWWKKLGTSGEKRQKFK